MMKTMLILPLTAALLAACGSTTPIPVTLNTLTVGGVSNTLQISAPAKLAVTATGSDGNPYTGTATFTSSDPSVVAVAADGTLTVRHLSVAPVVLTVSKAGKTASATVTTYGLNAAGGTNKSSENADTVALGSNFLVAFRNADGTASKTETAVTIQGPATFNGGAAVTTAISGTVNYGGYRGASLPIKTGTYTATATVGGVVYSKTFTVDATQVQPYASGVTVNLTQNGYAASGTLPDRSAQVYGVAYNTTSRILSYTENFLALPQTGPLDGLLVVGQQYNVGVYAQSYSLSSNKPFPEQVNRSFISAAWRHATLVV
jgi:hypothetical protein